MSMASASRRTIGVSVRRRRRLHWTTGSGLSEMATCVFVLNPSRLRPLPTFGENLRRARVPFVFKYDDFRINLTPDFGGGSPDGTPSLYEKNRLITTGALNARSTYEYGPEFGLRWRNFMLQGEYIRIGVDRTNGGATVRTPGLEFSGGYAEASWMVTGEPRRYVAPAGAFGNPRPAREFSLKDGGYGAFELVARYSHVDLNDRVTRAQPASTSTSAQWF